MNELGVSGCVEKREWILEQLRRNSEKYSWIDKFKIGINNATNPMAIRFLISGDIPSAMLDEAIKRASES